MLKVDCYDCDRLIVNNRNAPRQKPIEHPIIRLSQIHNILAQVQSLKSGPTPSLRSPIMRITQAFANAITYVSDAASRIFGLNDDNYPATGIQPFSGDRNDKKHTPKA